MSSVLWTVSLGLCAWTRPCPRCDRATSHVFAGRARLNANGKRLDAWLLFHCMGCERTARWPLLERVPVRRVDPELLARLQRNHDLDGLALAAVGGSEPRVTGPRPEAREAVRFQVQDGARVRLDRALAQGLGCSREAVRAAFAGDRVLRRPVVDGQVVAPVSGWPGPAP